MAFVTTLHLQASADAALSCKPGRSVTRGGHGSGPLTIQIKGNLSTLDECKTSFSGNRTPVVNLCTHI